MIARPIVRRRRPGVPPKAAWSSGRPLRTRAWTGRHASSNWPRHTAQSRWAPPGELRSHAPQTPRVGSWKAAWGAARKSPTTSASVSSWSSRAIGVRQPLQKVIVDAAMRSLGPPSAGSRGVANVTICLGRQARSSCPRDARRPRRRGPPADRQCRRTPGDSRSVTAGGISGRIGADGNSDREAHDSGRYPIGSLSAARILNPTEGLDVSERGEACGGQASRLCDSCGPRS